MTLRSINASCSFYNAFFAYLLPFCIVLAVSSMASNECTFFRWMFFALIGALFTQGTNICSSIVGNRLHRKYQHRFTPCRFVKRRRIRAVQSTRVKKRAIYRFSSTIITLLVMSVMFHNFLHRIASNVCTSKVDFDTTVRNACINIVALYSSIVDSYKQADLIHSILLHCTWHIPRKIRNKLKHALNGNMDWNPPTSSTGSYSKGSGRSKKGKKGAANALTPEQKEQQFQHA